MMNIYDQQKKNRRETWLIMMMFIILFCVLGIGFDFFFIPTGVPIGTIAALVIATISVIGGYYGGDQVVLASTGARPVDHSDLKEHQFHNVVEEVSIAAGMPVPKVYIVPDPDPNAFATGRDPKHSSIAITRGLLEKLNREELQGVVSHEMSHIRNYDIRMMTLVAALAGAIVLLSDWAGRAMRSMGRGRSSSRKGGGGAMLFFVIWLLLIILAPIIAQIMAFAISRKREYLADASGAELIRNPLALANALTKIENSVASTQSIKRGVAHLCIADPLGRSFTNKEGFVANLFATHPPMDSRVQRLKQMGYLYESGNPDYSSRRGGMNNVR